MSKAFFDTNVLIAFIFLINSVHPKSHEAFNFYSEFFWSEYVKKEFERRYPKKQLNLLEFFYDLEILFENPSKELYSSFDLEIFAKHNYSGKKMKDIISAINPFWINYFGIETQIPFDRMKLSIKDCLNDLIVSLDNKKQDLYNFINLTPQRTKNYSHIDEMLKIESVSDEDRIVVLDGHDFACQSSSPIDFVTFDDNCYNGALNVDLLCFESVKGKYDDFISS